MYPPPYYQTDDSAQLQAFLQQHYFGLLLSHSGGIAYTPLPFLLSWQQGDDKANCHLARHNPQLQQLAGALVQIVIQGPHAFVPASCYQQQPAVSTWNYALVELKGIARVLDNEQTLALVRQQEAHSAPAMAQSNATSSVFGTAPPGPDVTVVVENLATGLRRTLTPDAQGRFRASSLPSWRSSTRLPSGSSARAVRLSTQSPSLAYTRPSLSCSAARWMCPQTMPSSPRRRASSSPACTKRAM